MVRNNPETFADIAGHLVGVSGEGPIGNTASIVEMENQEELEQKAQEEKNKPQPSTFAPQDQHAEPNKAQNQNQGAGQSSGGATFNLSGATVTFNWATYTEPQGRGVEIEATVKGCDGCVWAQTVSGPDIKGGVKADIQPGADPQKYPYTGGGTHPNDLYDRPERSSEPAQQDRKFIFCWQSNLQKLNFIHDSLGT